MKLTVSLLVFVLLVGLGSLVMLKPESGVVASGKTSAPAANVDPNNVNIKPLELPLVEPRIEVSKSKRELRLYSAGKVVRVYRVGLGSNPNGDKTVQGDGRTPEGEFFVCSKNPKSNYYLSLGLSYPNEEDAERGLRDKLISKAVRDQILRSISARACPPWNTRLGGEVFIHGNGSATDWTLGCVALDNANMKELFEAIPKGTPVKIKP
ncbi:MAG TPA: L,D-transpeptidase [Blastocatellia bacterium]|nr:L,D-transpeptidase [Blastocatellia bacterium]